LISWKNQLVAIVLVFFVQYKHGGMKYESLDPTPDRGTHRFERRIATLTPPPPRISVVMPVFNAVHFLDVSVGSVVAQTCPYWELILVDDGSSDDGLRRCAEFTRTYANIRCVAQENAGPAAARNTGVRFARGDFIFFLDADDRLLPDALHDLLAVADAHDADMVLGNFIKQENDDPPVTQAVVLAPGSEPFTGDVRVLAGNDLLGYFRRFLSHPANHLAGFCWARLYRRARIVEHGLRANESLRVLEDFAFNLAFLGKVKRFVFMNRPVYVHFRRNQHISASMVMLGASDLDTFYRNICNFLLDLGITDADAERVRREARHTLVHYAIVNLVYTCWQMYTAGNRAHFHRQLTALVSAPVLRESLPYYAPRSGHSRLLPLLMRLKWVRLLAIIAKKRGLQRYGKPKVPNHET
jgi:glycosyltransferase involved in cell wall biosynthesis